MLLEIRTKNDIFEPYFENGINYNIDEYDIENDIFKPTKIIRLPMNSNNAELYAKVSTVFNIPIHRIYLIKAVPTYVGVTYELIQNVSYKSLQIDSGVHANSKILLERIMQNNDKIHNQSDTIDNDEVINNTTSNCDINDTHIEDINIDHTKIASEIIDNIFDGVESIKYIDNCDNNDNINSDKYSDNYNDSLHNNHYNNLNNIDVETPEYTGNNIVHVFNENTSKAVVCYNNFKAQLLINYNKYPSREFKYSIKADFRWTIGYFRTLLSKECSMPCEDIRILKNSFLRIIL
jgi:hypothetical protein